MSMMDIVGQQVFGRQEAAKQQLEKASQEWQAMKDKYSSAYKGMLSTLKPEIDTEKEKRLRNMGKTQAITDFITALTSGVIGTASKGYSPQVGANAQPYAVNLENLRELNKQRQENYDKLKVQADLSLAENDLRSAEGRYQAALKGVEDANEAGRRYLEKLADQEFKKELTAAQIAAQMANEDAKRAGKTKTYVVGDGEFTIPDNYNITPLYANLVKNGVPAFTKKEVRVDDIGNPVVVDVKVTAPTPQEFFYWVSQNFDAVYPYLANNKNISINRYERVLQPAPSPTPTPEQTPYYDSATPTGRYITPNYNKDEKEQEKPNNSSFYAPQGLTHFKWQ